MTIPHHHVLASKINIIRHELKQLEHYIDATPDFDVAATRNDLNSVATAVYELASMLSEHAHEGHQSLDELFNDTHSTDKVETNDARSGVEKEHE